MPEFKMDTSGTVLHIGFADLALFTQGYVEAMLFTNNAPGESMVDWDENAEYDGSIPEDASFSDMYPPSFDRIQQDCIAFERAAYNQLEAARKRGYTMDQAGRDFWFTRNRHGVGFEDRKQLEPTGAAWDATRIPLDQWTEEVKGDYHRLKAASLGTQLAAIARTFGEVNASFGQVVSGAASPTGYGWIIVE